MTQNLAREPPRQFELAFFDRQINFLNLQILCIAARLPGHFSCRRSLGIQFLVAISLCDP